jgi:hypothetical protein
LPYQDHSTESYSVSKDYQQVLTVQVNCSDSKTSKKVLTFDATDDKSLPLLRKFYIVAVFETTNFMDQSKVVTGQVSHMQHIMKPIIYQADSSLLGLTPQQ